MHRPRPLKKNAALTMPAASPYLSAAWGGGAGPHGSAVLRVAGAAAKPSASVSTTPSRTSSGEAQSMARSSSGEQLMDWIHSPDSPEARDQNASVGSDSNTFAQLRTHPSISTTVLCNPPSPDRTQSARSVPDDLDADAEPEIAKRHSGSGRTSPVVAAKDAVNKTEAKGLACPPQLSVGGPSGISKVLRSRPKDAVKPFSAANATAKLDGLRDADMIDFVCGAHEDSPAASNPVKRGDANSLGPPSRSTRTESRPASRAGASMQGGRSEMDSSAGAPLALGSAPINSFWRSEASSMSDSVGQRNDHAHVRERSAWQEVLAKDATRLSLSLGVDTIHGVAATVSPRAAQRPLPNYVAQGIQGMTLQRSPRRRTSPTQRRPASAVITPRRKSPLEGGCGEARNKAERSPQGHQSLESSRRPASAASPLNGRTNSSLLSCGIQGQSRPNSTAAGGQSRTLSRRFDGLLRQGVNDVDKSEKTVSGFNGTEVPEDYFVDGEGESSPELDSPVNGSSIAGKSSGSTHSPVSPDTFGIDALKSRQHRLREANEELDAILSGTQTQSMALCSVSPPHWRPGSTESHSANSNSNETSPLSLGSAPVHMHAYKPQPPTAVKSDIGGSVNLPPVRIAPQVVNPSNTKDSPPLLGSAPESGSEKFRKAVRRVQKNMAVASKSTGKASTKPASAKVSTVESPIRLNRLTSPRPMSRGYSPPPSPLPRRPTVSKTLAPSAGHHVTGSRFSSTNQGPEQRATSPNSGQRLNASPLAQSTRRSAGGGGSPCGEDRSGLRRNLSNSSLTSRRSGGDSPTLLRRNISQSSLHSPVRHLHHHSIFDQKKACLYVCPRGERGGVLSKLIDVRGIYRSIQQAVTHAVDGDTIQVTAGMYEESLNIGTNVFIKCVAGEDVTIRGRGLSTIKCSAATMKIEGLTIEHAGGDSSLRGRDGARCIEVHGGDVEIVKCEVTSSIGSGVMLLDGGSARLRRTNVCDNGRCGVICFDEAHVHCEDCVVKDNGLNGVDLQAGSTATLSRCKIDRNSQTGVLVSDSDTHAAVLDCTIQSNDRRGITAQHSASFHIQNCDILNNRDLGVFILGDHSPCACLFVNCNIKGNLEGALTIHGSLPDYSSCTIEGVVSLLNTPKEPSPWQIARNNDAATTIQCAWLRHLARHIVRAKIQDHLRGVAEEAARQDKKRQEERESEARSRSSSPTNRTRSPVHRRESQACDGEDPAMNDDCGDSSRYEGMAALEASVIDTLNRFDKLGSRMDSLLSEASQVATKEEDVTALQADFDAYEADVCEQQLQQLEQRGKERAAMGAGLIGRSLSAVGEGEEGE